MIKNPSLHTVEAKIARFVKIGETRITLALKRIDLVSELSNREKYEYTEDQANRVIEALQQAVDNLKEDFKAVPDTKPFAFKD